MISQGIIIPWIFSDEYIQIIFSEIQNKPRIIQTIDVSRKSSEMLKLIVDSKWDGPDQNNEYHLTLIYNKAKNTHIIEDGYDTFWGIATIDINPRNNTGKANWKGFKTNNWNGSVEWQKRDEDIIGERKKERVSRIKRQQTQLRQALLTLDAKCAICGEVLPEVLEAAHIIPASDGGKEFIENAILLRADFHRLLDAKLIFIDSNGSIKFSQELPQNYKDELKNKSISNETLDRIRNAITYTIQK